MIYTFANRTVGLVGQFETPIELMRLAIFYLGGNCVTLDSPYFIPDVIVIGMNTPIKAINAIEDHFMSGKASSIPVFEGKINDHMPEDKLFCDILDRVKSELPWGEAY